VQVTVLTEGRTGILGLGAEDAKVRLTVVEPEPPPPPDPTEMAKATLCDLLQLMGIKADVLVRRSSAAAPSSETPAIILDISGDDLGILIGRRGETLTSLQFIANLIVSRKLASRTRIIVDVEGYRLRREDSLRGLALRMADRVRSTMQPITLEAMPANERRIVHLALANEPDIATQSFGEGDDRKVVISPKK